MNTEELLSIVLRFGLNAIAMGTLLFGFYYRRHGDRILTTTAAMFNIFAFAVLAKLSNVEFGLAAGFGLFAILALFNLRSEQIGRIEIAYFFGAISIAVIFSIAVASLGIAVILVLLVLLGVYIVDHPKVVPNSQVIRMTLDSIDDGLLSDPVKMRSELGKRLGVSVSGIEVVDVNFVNELAVVRLTYNKV